MPSIYLAGGISGCSYYEAVGWRDEVAKRVFPGVMVLSPMRSKQFLTSEKQLPRYSEHKHPLASAKGLVSRDHFDVKNCDVVLVNLLGARDISIGTMVEIGWASAYGKTIVLVMEDCGNRHDHPFVRVLANYITDTLEDAVAIVNNILAAHVEVVS